MASGFDATAFRSNLKHGGARPNLFRVDLTFPAEGANASEPFTFLCESASLPGFQLGQIGVHYFGRQIKFAGDRTFESWNINVINDEDFVVRNAFEAWQNRLGLIDHETQAREHTIDVGGHEMLYVDITVTQFAKDSTTELKRYHLKKAWPSNIGPIELSWETNDQIEKFPVTFEYDYFVTDEIDGMHVSV